MFSFRKLIKDVIGAFLIFLVIAAGAYYYWTQNEPRNYSSQPPEPPQITKAVTPSPGATVLTQVNAVRVKQNMSPLEEDPALCRLAKTTADDTALAYPEESQIELKVEGYKTVKKNQISVNDALVELAKSEGQTIHLSDEVIAQYVTAAQNPIQIALDPEINAACAAVSEEGMGQKPFGIFIGGVK